MYIVLFPCPHCGHNNRPARRSIDSLKLWLQDKLPPCRSCGRPLEQDDFYYIHEAASSLVKRARKELGHAEAS